MKSFHDFNIYEYGVNCGQREITLKLKQHHGSESGTVILGGVIGHRFEKVLEGNIVLSIEEYKPLHFHAQFKNEILEYVKWGLPLRFESSAEFEAQSNQKNLKFIVISSSYGLSGWVICTSVSVA